MTNTPRCPRHGTTTGALLRSLKASEQDFEWYPTTDEIIDCVRNDLLSMKRGFEDDIHSSILDCGAGDGRVLAALTQGKKYAIEKAFPLIEALPSNVFVVGTDFHQQTLIDKRVDCVFSNPPYSEFVPWARKIILEANAPLVYLVIPERWKDNADIQAAVDARRAWTEVLGRFDFENADRCARAKVHVVRVNLQHTREHMNYWQRESRPKVDPFDLWFESHFNLQVRAEKSSDYDTVYAVRSGVKTKVAEAGTLIKNEGLVKTLETFYQRDMDHLIKNYLAVCELDPDLLAELQVSVSSVKEALKLKISSLKDVYWQELFDNLSTITDRLTSSSRQKILDKLTAHTHVDFTSDNAQAIVIWAVKNANEYFDEQLIEIVERMVGKANVVMYRSNQRTFGDEAWRYCRRPEGLDRYKLEYRVVLDRIGGICNSEWNWEHTKSGLTNGAAAFLDDLCTVAYNIGFDTYGVNCAHSHQWVSGRKQLFHYRDPETDKLHTLFETKAYKNGNLHIRFAQDFMMRLNVEFGRLKGWVRNSGQAAKEMDIPQEQAAAVFNSNLKLVSQAVAALTSSAA